MILSDRDIKKYLKEGKIKIIPKPDLKTQLGSCSIDLRLGNTFRVFEYTKRPYVDTKKESLTVGITKEIKIKKGEAFIMHPGEFVLARTEEDIELPDDLIGRLEGRSSLGRLGIVVHSTASLFDPGWRGKATMELGNLGKMPVALYPGMRICAFTFENLTSPAETPYYKKKNAKYLGEKSFSESKITEER
jgi:dCTP deaminase